MQTHVDKAETHLPAFHPSQEEKKLKENGRKTNLINKQTKNPREVRFMYQNKRFSSEYNYENKGVLQIEKQLLVVPPAGFFHKKKKKATTKKSLIINKKISRAWQDSKHCNFTCLPDKHELFIGKEVVKFCLKWVQSKSGEIYLQSNHVFLGQLCTTIYSNTIFPSYCPNGVFLQTSPLKHPLPPFTCPWQ